MVRERHHEQGGSKLKILIVLCVLGAVVFVAAKIVPVYFANYQFQDSVQTEVRFAVVNYPTKTADDLQNDLWKKAQELGIPTQKDAIRVAMDNHGVEIDLDYSVPIDLVVYQLNLQFHPYADKRGM
jgi:hypothetical protein